MQKEYLEFLEVRGRYLTSGSTKTYRRCLSLLDEIVDKPFQQITDLDLAKFKDELDKRYASQTVKLVFIIVKSLFRFWHGERDCLNPNRIPNPKAKSKLRHSVTQEEFEKIYATLTGNTLLELQRMIILRILWETGARVNEICSIKLEDIEVGKAFVQTEKTIYQRHIFWSQSTEELLQRYLKIRQHITSSDYLFMGFNRNGKGFCPKSRKLQPRSVERWLKKAKEKAQVETDVVPHSFRHSRIQRWFDLGLNPYEVIQLSGHTNVISLQNYMRFGLEKVESNARVAMG